MSGTGNSNDSYPVYGPQVKRPLRVRVLQYASLVLAFAGLALLYLYSIDRGIPVIHIADITPTMNFAYVRVAGEVSRDTYVFDSGGVVFNVKDGSGEIAVMGGRAQAEALKADGKLPRRGDQVDVAGSLSISADQEPKLRMQSAGQLKLQKKSAPAARPVSRITLADITAAQKDDVVTVIAKLKAIDIPGPGAKTPYVLTLEEDGAELAVVFWEDVFQGLENSLPIPGKLIRAKGAVSVYQGTVQLKIRDADDLSVVTEQEKQGVITERPLSRVADIAAGQEGKIFTVSGTLGEPRSIRGGVIYPLNDGSGEIAVLFWDKQISGDERAALEFGVRLRVTAPLVVYKGTLELVPADAGGFRIE